MGKGWIAGIADSAVIAGIARESVKVNKSCEDNSLFYIS
jgi:hypothetical protein